MVEDHLKNPQSYRIQQSTSRSNLPSYTSNNSLKEILSEKNEWLNQQGCRDGCSQKKHVAVDFG